MIMIPLPFFITAAALFTFYREWANIEPHRRNSWFLCFLATLAFQETLIGVRFGYGQEWLREIQPVTAAMLPALAYLSFKRLSFRNGAMLLALPTTTAILLALFALNLLDTFLAANNLFYAAALALLGLGGSDALGWVEIGRERLVRGLLWLVCSLLIISGLTDAIISYDFWANSGTNTSSIAGWASMAGILIAATIITMVTSWNRLREKSTSTPNIIAEKAVFTRLEKLLYKERLFLDSEINLNRIARRMVLPAREVSRAINGQTGGNASQYINKLRVEEACHLLKNSDMQITQIVFASGFNTKSNFNREFARVINKTPSQWRSVQ
ncbi:MAG: hypothetical protein COB78_12135 [Hyphomicrobiales bacterium]|nr:MAG: hypothetical protein COB78_12135 [Hyphomicrobiales bacterium]